MDQRPSSFRLGRRGAAGPESAIGGKTREMMRDFKAPHDAIRLANGSILVNELGSKSLLRVSGEHGKDRTSMIGGL